MTQTASGRDRRLDAALVAVKIAASKSADVAAVGDEKPLTATHDEVVHRPVPKGKATIRVTGPD